MSDGDEIATAWSAFKAAGWAGDPFNAYCTCLFGAAHAVLCSMGEAKLREHAEKVGRSKRWTWGIPTGLPGFQDFATDACIAQMSKFIERLRLGSDKAWQPGKGASALTYFVTGILLDLPNLAQTWRREHEHVTREAPVECVDDHRRRSDDQDELAPVLRSCELEGTLSKAPLQVAKGLRLKLEGLSDQQIAAELGISVVKLRQDRTAFCKKIQEQRGTE